MKLIELLTNDCLSSIEYNPSPHRFNTNEKSVSERSQLPIIYTCQNCTYKLTLKESDFLKHTESTFSNLSNPDRSKFLNHLTLTKDDSFLDFYCPNCQQPTTIIFVGGYTGYWGMYGFKIKRVLVIEQ